MLSKVKFTRSIAILCTLVLTVGLLAACGAPAAKDTATPPPASAAPGSQAPESTPLPPDKKVELSIAHIGALESPSNLAVEYFIKLVDERSEGTIKITNYPASQLGGDRDIMEGIVGGSIDMGVPGAGITALYLPEYYVFDTPYMFVSHEHLHKVIDGELGQEIADKFLETNGVRVLAQNWERGVRQTIFAKEVTDLDGYKGAKIRLPEVASYVKGFELLGTKPTIISFPETYSALQQGVVVGMECPLDWIYDNKFYEVCKYLVIDNHDYSVMTLLINEKKFQTMSENQRKIMLEAAVEAGEYENQLLRDNEAVYLKNMEEAGVTISRPDLQKFIDAVEPMLPEFDSVWGEGMYERVKSYR